MRLIEENGKWFWINYKKEVVSPKFDTEDEANKWYKLHNNWLESPAILR